MADKPSKFLTFQQRSRQIACFVVCFLLMAVVAVSHDSRLFGIHIPRPGEEETEEIEPLTLSPEGEEVINTTPLSKDIIGYRGPTPLEITLRDGKIVKVKPLKNNETPEFFGAVMNSDLLDSWDGLTLEEASKVHPDAVSGATITSTAIIRNAEAGFSYALSRPLTRTEGYEAPLDFKFFCVIGIILAACILPFFVKGRLYRIIQLVLNVVILGFWGGTFISYALMTSLMANGIRSWLMIPLVLMLVPAFFFPFFGRKNHYCTWICPYGSIQDLAGQCFRWQLNVSQAWARRLALLRDVLWVALMWLMMTGLWFEWMDWEPFSAFFFKDTSPIVLGIAGGFLLLSFFVRRPYCRFVCPTGTLFKISEGNR